ncbi:choice-of-anchor D domain-containing protein [Eubacteriales bacterium OttesenSCG-928-N14]|nr:choice-of-anchor D domain-containing protein [Eubacteriales bacterium OttesenSCG-928-N14]
MKKRFAFLLSICMLLALLPIVSLPQTVGAAPAAPVAVGSYMVQIPQGATPGDYYTWDDTNGLTILKENVTITGMSSNVTVKRISVQIPSSYDGTTYITGTVQIDVLHINPSSDDRIIIQNSGVLTVAAVTVPDGTGAAHRELMLEGNGSATVAGGPYHLKITSKAQVTVTGSFTGNNGRVEISSDEECVVTFAAGASVAKNLGISRGTLNISAFSKSSKLVVGGTLDVGGSDPTPKIVLPAGAVAGENISDYVAAGNIRIDNPAEIYAGSTKIGALAADGSITTNPIIICYTATMDFGTLVVGGGSQGTRRWYNVSNLTGSVTATLTGTNANQFVLEHDEISRAVTVYYNPTSVGTHSATVTLQSPGVTSLNIPLTGTCIAAGTAKVTANTTSLNFGSVVKYGSKEMSVTISATDLTENMEWEIRGANQRYFEISDSGVDRKTGGALTIKFTAHEVGDFSATLVIRSKEAPMVSIPLTATASGITINPSYSLDFGDVLKGTTATRTVAVSGSGLSAAMDISIIGDTAYTVKKAAGWNDLTGGMLEVQFAPAAANRAYNAELVVKSGAVEARIHLAGHGSDKGIVANPGSLVFTTGLGQISAPLTVDISGVGITGNLTYKITDMAGGQEAGAFTVKTGGSWNAASGGQLQVTFAPKSIRSYSAVLEIKDTAGITTYINLIGETTDASRVNFTKAPATVKVGQSATFETDAKSTLLSSIAMDGKVLTIKTEADGKVNIYDADGNKIGSISGSNTTVLNLDAAYLKKLGVGEHTLRVGYDELGSAIAVFRMYDGSTSPATGDDVNGLTWLWIVLGGLAVTIILVMRKARKI